MISIEGHTRMSGNATKKGGFCGGAGIAPE